jgi:hypothetical protein
MAIKKQTKEKEKIIILQDLEDENLFYVSSKEDWDDEDERSIIGYGDSREKALMNALENALKTNQNCLKTIRSIGNLISHSSFCDLRDDLYITTQDIPLPNERGLTFSAICYDKEEQKWFRFLR